MSDGKIDEKNELDNNGNTNGDKEDEADNNSVSEGEIVDDDDVEEPKAQLVDFQRNKQHSETNLGTIFSNN